MRWLAAVVVVIYHRNWTLPGSHWFHLGHGWLAVDFFFILSGFVLARAYDGDLAAPGGLARFARRRVIRLGPLLVLGGALGLVSALVLGDVTLPGALLNAVGLPAPPGWSGAPFRANGPVWSLFFEALANALHALIVARLPRLFVPALILSALAWAIMLARVEALNQTGIFYATFGWGAARSLFPFLLGVWLARRGADWPMPVVRPAVIWLVLLSALLLPTAPRVFPSSVYAAFCVLALFPALILAADRVRLSPVASRRCVALGGMSYAIYAMHMPVLRLSDVLVTRGILPGRAQVAVMIGPILLLGWAAWRWFDRPLRGWLARHGQIVREHAAK